MEEQKELINDIEGFLKNFNDVLLSEIHLEVLLALHLKETGNYQDVYAEYTFPKKVLGKEYQWGKENDKVSVDLVIYKDDEYIPIELKFKTRKEELNINLFGCDKKIELAMQGARNNTSYDFWKDVKRIEIIKNKFAYVKAGIVLFVTTDERYKKEPEKGSQYAPFSTHEKRVLKAGTKLAWDERKTKVSKNKKTRHPEFTVSHDYELNWKDVGSKKQELKYLLLSV